MNCPNCGTKIPATPAQLQAARENGKKGGRPVGSKDRQPRKRKEKETKP